MGNVSGATATTLCPKHGQLHCRNIPPFFLAVLTSQYFHSRYRLCAGSGNTKVNKMNVFFPSGPLRSGVAQGLPQEMCHKSLPSDGAKFHTTDKCLTSLNSEIKTMPIIGHITQNGT